jgi:Tfp pilus assembly protein PilF
MGCPGPTGEEEKAIQRAKIHFKNGHYSKALAEYEQVLTGNPDSYEARLGVGRCYLAKKEFNKARDAFERTSTMRP